MSSIFAKESSPIKRQLSLEEKLTIHNFSGKAIILPGSCGSVNEPLELEELISVGFDPSQIIGFENLPSNLKKLKDYYKDSLMLSDINKNIKNIDPDSVSYIHLDFLRSITQHTMSKAKYYSSIMKSDSRFRITVGSNWGRGGGQSSDNYQLANIKNIAYEIFIPLCKKVGLNPHKISKVEKQIESQFPDRSHPNYFPINHKEATGFHGQLGTAMFLFCSFGIRTAINYASKENVIKSKIILNNSNIKYAYYLLNDVKQFRYKKDNEKYTLPMYTSWFTVNRQKTDIVYFLDQLCNFILTPLEMYDYNSN